MRIRLSIVLLLLAGSLSLAEAGLVENVACASDATQTYTLYLPSQYSTARKWPVLFVFDPRGRGTFAAELFRAGAEEYGWIILSSNNTRSDTTWDPNVRALEAMVPELRKYAVDPQRMYAAGFSGGATVAWVLAKAKHFAGVINAGQPWQAYNDAAHASFAVWSATGTADFNNRDVRRIDADVAQSGQPHHVEVFDGVHQWMPEPLARGAIAWYELQAMRAGTRSVDATLVDKLYASEMQRSTSSELASLRRYEGIVRDFDRIHDTDDAVRAAAVLRNSPRVREQTREESNADGYETRELAKVIDRLNHALAEETTPSSVKRLISLDRLRQDASQQTAQGAAARRIVETLFVQTGFYLPQKYFDSHDYNKAAIVLAIAADLKADRPDIQYDLARALALTARNDEALAALERAIKLGVKNVDPRTDPAFASIVALPRFEAIIRAAPAREGS